MIGGLILLARMRPEVLVRFLTEQAQVNYPRLESHPQYERAQRLFAGADGVLSFELHGGVEAAEDLCADFGEALDEV